jgi:hypothetical protein
MRVLDEVADAIRIARGGLTHPVLSSVVLEDIFGGPITPRQWARIQKHLACPLPPLEFDQGHWFRTDDFETVWDLVAYIAKHHPDWEPPLERTTAAWRNAQIFVGVRVEVAEAGSLRLKDVVRSARLRRDLRLE